MRERTEKKDASYSTSLILPEADGSGYVLYVGMIDDCTATSNKGNVRYTGIKSERAAKSERP